MMDTGNLNSRVKPNSWLTNVKDARLSLCTTIIMFWSAMAALFIITTYAPKVITESGWFGISAKVLLNITVSLWVLADGRDRQVSEESLRWYVPFSILLTEFAIPVYLVKTRGWKGAAITSMHFIVYIVIAAIVMAVVSMSLELFGIQAEV